jgi:AraC family transcriptional regulator, regulatory protein of adaptative response / methylated-DNA-[protein]-cysteine methyltransferase
MTTLPTIQQMQRAYRRSDTSYDGIFYLGVRTTGIFCKPSCGARKPRPQNVAYFSTPREALFAGFRPCKRCRPMAASGSPPAWVRELLDHVERQARITDVRLRELRIDPARARRYFRAHYGMTFQAYCRGRRLGNALQQIRRGRPLDDVTLGHGYESHSGFRSAFAKRFGAPPGRMREGEAVVVTWIESPLGPLVAAAAGEAVVLLEFTERRMLDTQFRTIRKHFRLPIIPGENEVLRKLRRELAEYFARKRRSFTVPVRIPGSAFQQRVWQALRRIPYGRSISYQELAAQVGSPRAMRAVGRTNGLNRVAIVVPCHRVVAKDGALSGYGGGIWRKQALLELERGERLYDAGAHSPADVPLGVRSS